MLDIGYGAVCRVVALNTRDLQCSNPVIGNFYLLSIVFEVLNKAVNGPLLCK